MFIPQTFRKADLGQRGAALITVLMISVLLLTASVAMLTAVGANSKNTTDVLSETKAYYAAESGIQASINVLRNQGVNYAQAAADPDLSTWLGTNPVAVGSESQYSISVRDPDNSSASTTYTSTGSFATSSVAAWTSSGGTPATNWTEITFVPPGAPVTLNHPVSAPYPSLGSFQIIKHGTGGTLPQLLFKINYQMSSPRPGVRSIRGEIQVSGNNITVHFDASSYTLSGGTIDLCQTSACSSPGTFPDATFANTANPPPISVYAKIAPLDPYRLVVLSTGFGPNGSKKQLESILERNFFDDASAGPPVSMVGPNANFDPGTSNQMSIQGGSNPSIGVSDAAGLQTVLGSHTNGTMTPPPQIVNDDLPSWEQSPANMDALIRQLRQSAQNTGRYFTSGPGNQGWGNSTTGTGLTFCEGDCSMTGNTDGGGILVVTGTFSTNGNPTFKGLILVVGAGGVQRSGGGNEVFTGNIVIAPYDPNNLAAGWLSPNYSQHGGSGDTIYSNVAADVAFNGTSAITDFVAGVAEK